MGKSVKLRGNHAPESWAAQRTLLLLFEFPLQRCSGGRVGRGESASILLSRHTSHVTCHWLVLCCLLLGVTGTWQLPRQKPLTGSPPMQASTVTEYLAALPADRREALNEVRRAINRPLPPGYKEKSSGA